MNMHIKNNMNHKNIFFYVVCLFPFLFLFIKSNVFGQFSIPITFIIIIDSNAYQVLFYFNHIGLIYVALIYDILKGIIIKMKTFESENLKDILQTFNSEK